MPEGVYGVDRQIILHYPNARGVEIMHIDEFAHAVGVVYCRPPLGDLDLAPGPIHVDADEEIDGAVAAVLAIVAFELARFGWDRLANLAMSSTGLSSKQTTGRSGSGVSA